MPARPSILATLIVGLTLVVSASAHAASFTWDAGAGTSAWATAANWNPDQVPGSGDTVTIGFNATASPTLDQNRTIGGLTMTTSGGGSTLTIPVGLQLSVSGQTTFGNGGVSGVSVAGGGTLALAGPTSLPGNNVSLDGDSVLTLAGTTTWAGGNVQVTGPHTPALNVLNTGTVNVTTGAPSAAGFGSNGSDTFRNTGTINIGGSGAMGIKNLDNDGIVALTGGATLTLAGSQGVSPFISSGSWSVGAGTTLSFFSGQDTWQGTGSGITGVGRLVLASNGSLAVGPGAAFAPGSLELSNFSAALTLSDDFSGAGDLADWDGSIRFLSGASLSFASVSATFDGGESLEMAGSPSETGTLTLPASSITQTAGNVSLCGVGSVGPTLVFQGITQLNGNGITGCAFPSGTGTVRNDGTMTHASGDLWGGLTAFQNTGTLNLSRPSGGPTIAKLQNTGTVNVTAGNYGDGGLGNAFSQSAGTTTVAAGATLNTDVTLTGGTLKGTGTIRSIVNGGTVAPGASPGTLTVSGGYTQTAAGTLAIELGGTAQGVSYDRLAVQGAATLAGTVAVTQVDGFTPTPDQAFDVVTASAISGDFGTRVGTVGGRPWTSSNLGDHVRLTLGALPPPPVNGTTPSVSGAATVGATLTCDPGTWSDPGATLTITWLRDGAPIPGAAGTTLVVTAADQGTTISCRVVATNPGGESPPAVSPGRAIPAAPAPAPTPPAPAAPAATTPPTAVAITQIATLPSPKSCVSRRKFPIRLRGVKANRIVRAQIKLNGKLTRTVTGKALGLPIDLRGLPKGRFTVEIVTTDSAGKRLVGKRTYRTCVPKRR